MPPKVPKKQRNQAEQEGRILLALKCIQNKEITNIHEVTHIYNVPKTTLLHCLNGCVYRPEKRANNHKLTDNEEESLVQWILSMEQHGAPPQPAHIHDMANILLLRCGSTNIQTVGINWVSTFIK